MAPFPTSSLSSTSSSLYSVGGRDIPLNFLCYYFLLVAPVGDRDRNGSHHGTSKISNANFEKIHEKHLLSVVTVFCATFSQIRISCLWLEICYPFSCGPVRHTQKTRNKNLQWTEESETCSDTLQPPSPVVANVEVCYKRTDGSQTAKVVFGRHLQTKKQTFTVFGDWWHGTKALSHARPPHGFSSTRGPEGHSQDS